MKNFNRVVNKMIDVFKGFEDLIHRMRTGEVSDEELATIELGIKDLIKKCEEYIKEG